VGRGYEAPSQVALNAFVEGVRQQGVHVTVRQELGQDIASACGQLVVAGAAAASKKGALDGGTRGLEVRDVEDLGGGGCGGSHAQRNKTDAEGINGVVPAGGVRRRGKRGLSIDDDKGNSNGHVSRGDGASWVGMALALGIFTLVGWRVWGKIVSR
jgi:hypothetical protein